MSTKNKVKINKGPRRLITMISEMIRPEMVRVEKNDRNGKSNIRFRKLGKKVNKKIISNCVHWYRCEKGIYDPMVVLSHEDPANSVNCTICNRDFPNAPLATFDEYKEMYDKVFGHIDTLILYSIENGIDEESLKVLLEFRHQKQEIFKITKNALKVINLQKTEDERMGNIDSFSGYNDMNQFMLTTGGKR